MSSEGHQKIGKILSEPPFAHYRTREEYPVVEVNPLYENSRHRFDWAIIDLKLIIEVHGEQHYKPVCFGGMDIEQAVSNLYDQEYRDEKKRQAAIDAGWIYLSIPYWKLKDITGKDILGLYLKEVEQTGKVEELTDSYQEKMKERQRQYKRSAYRKWKACQKE